MSLGRKRMDISVSGGREGSQPRGGEGENGKQKTQGGRGAQGLRRVRVDVRKVPPGREGISDPQSFAYCCILSRHIHKAVRS